MSVWPFVDGSWADYHNSDHGRQAANLLARLHHELAGLTNVGACPRRADIVDGHRSPPEVDDPDLDRWLTDFMEQRPVRQPLHGDVYEANVLVRQDRIAALVDWDDVFLGPPEQELAWVAAEWGSLRQTQDLSDAVNFIDEYIAAGGRADRIGAEELAQLTRGCIRMEATEERDYEANQVETFRALRP